MYGSRVPLASRGLRQRRSPKVSHEVCNLPERGFVLALMAANLHDVTVIDNHVALAVGLERPVPRGCLLQCVSGALEKATQARFMVRWDERTFFVGHAMQPLVDVRYRWPHAHQCGQQS